MRILSLLAALAIVVGCGGPGPGEELEPNPADKGKASHLGSDSGAEQTGPATTESN